MKLKDPTLPIFWAGDEMGQFWAYAPDPCSLWVVRDPTDAQLGEGKGQEFVKVFYAGFNDFTTDAAEAFRLRNRTLETTPMF